MKIQCDVCSKSEAAVFCSADEAALCGGCDHQVHHANKLASKHHRFSLINPSSSSKQSPLCDICQEKRAFLFCQQDRAILCKDCDQSIHSANELTQKHNRFVLTGVKLSPTSHLYESPSKSVSDHHSTTTTTAASAAPPPLSKTSFDDTATGVVAGGLTSSSISEYLIETLPGWRVEDLLLENNNNNLGFVSNKMTSGDGNGEDVMLSPFLDCGVENGNMGIWVPQAPSPLVYQSSDNMVGFKDMSCMKTYNNNTRFSDDGSFTVPQINLASVGSKRSRGFW